MFFMNIEELARLVQNMIRLGTVLEVQYQSPPRVRVKTGELETNWLAWAELRAGTTKTWNPPTIGEQVIVLSPGGDLTGGIVIPAINSNSNPAPVMNKALHHVTYPDGATVEYNHQSSTLNISGINKLNINASAELSINCPTTLINGDVIQSGGTLSSNGVVLDSHVHTGVSPGGATTGGPV